MVLYPSCSDCLRPHPQCRQPGPYRLHRKRIGRIADKNNPLGPDRIRRALPFVAKERVILAPDCGMKYLSREVAVGKLRAMVEAARMLRAEFGAE